MLPRVATRVSLSAVVWLTGPAPVAAGGGGGLVGSLFAQERQPIPVRMSRAGRTGRARENLMGTLPRVERKHDDAVSGRLHSPREIEAYVQCGSHPQERSRSGPRRGEESPPRAGPSSPRTMGVSAMRMRASRVRELSTRPRSTSLRVNNRYRPSGEAQPP